MKGFHRLRMALGGCVLSAFILGVFFYGLDYYRLNTSERVLSPKHEQLKPSGSVGLKLGIAGAFMLASLYVYPLRKKWRWLQKIGKTKNWLDVHVLLGVTAPLMITLHSSFKLGGIAGAAYWLMIVAMVSGYVGRYLYAQIPRSMNATTLTLNELQELCVSTAQEMVQLGVFSEAEIATFTKSQLATGEKDSFSRALLTMVWSDIHRPFQLAALRRKFMSSGSERLLSLGGILPSSHPELERAVALARKESWLIAKMALLTNTKRIFRLWHVIHWPFSYSFALLAMVHVAVVIWMGYF